jgi:hypothetical protein
MQHFFLFFFVFSSAFGFAQGCSDAGIYFVADGFQSGEKELKNSVGIATVFRHS